MPSIFRLVNHALAGNGVNAPDLYKAHSSHLTLQDLTLAKASSPGNETVSRERKRLSIRSLSVPVTRCQSVFAENDRKSKDMKDWWKKKKEAKE